MSLLALYEHHKNRYILSGDDPLSYCAHTNNMAVRLKTLDRFGPFVDHPRGADTVFVRKVVDALGPGVVRYAEGMRVEHRELRSPRLYFKKMFIYGGSFQSYSRVVAARSIGTRERVTIWWRTCPGGGACSWRRCSSPGRAHPGRTILVRRETGRCRPIAEAGTLPRLNHTRSYRLQRKQ